MFTKQEIIDKTNAYHDNCDESDVVDAWMELATDWLTNDPHEYLKDGFDGFNDRSVDQILCDFYLNKLVKDMSQDDFNALMDKSCNHYQ